MELANTCNEGDKSGAKCFVQLQVRCELTQDVEVQREGGRLGVGRAAGEDGARVGCGGVKEGRQHKEKRGHLKFHRCLQLVEVSHAWRLQATGRQRGSGPLGTSDCYHHGEMEGEYHTLLNIDQISSRAAAPFDFIASFSCFHVLEQ